MSELNFIIFIIFFKFLFIYLFVDFFVSLANCLSRFLQVINVNVDVNETK